jgi:peptidyl-tRNA hydrolase
MNKNIEQRNLVVYLLSRNDLTSMSHGKELAQAQHCGVQMMAKYANHKDVKEYIAHGKKQGADGFNTTITLETYGEDIKNIIYF